MKTQLFMVTTLLSSIAAADPTPAASTATPPIPVVVPEPFPTAPAETPIPSFFRMDQDYMLGLQLWAGATYPLMNSIGLSSDIFMVENTPGINGTKLSNSWWGEFDIGPAITLGPLSLTPMAGIAFDWAAKRAVALNAPQLYTIVNLDKIYFESWIWALLYSPFKNAVFSDFIHTRDWVLYKATKTISVGPQFEYSYNFNNKLLGAKGATAAPFGGHVELAFGTGNSVGLFLGYELSKTVRDRNGGAAEGRLTFVHNF